MMPPTLVAAAAAEAIARQNNQVRTAAVRQTGAGSTDGTPSGACLNGIAGQGRRCRTWCVVRRWMRQVPRSTAAERHASARSFMLLETVRTAGVWELRSEAHHLHDKLIAVAALST